MIKALATANYNGILCANTRRSLQAAAARWGAEYHEFTRENHPIQLHPATVKAEVFDLIPEAEAIFIVDADAIIRADCPSPFEQLPAGKFSVVDISPRLDPAGSIDFCCRMEWDKLCRLTEPLEYGSWRYFNSGVMMAFRTEHAAAFKLAFELCHIPNDLGWIEQTPLNYAAKRLGLEMNYADETWNYISPEGMSWPHGDFSRPMRHWIYHFAGGCGREQFMEFIRWDA